MSVLDKQNMKVFDKQNMSVLDRNEKRPNLKSKLIMPEISILMKMM